MMNLKTHWICSLAICMGLTGVSQAQQMEAVHGLNYENTARARAALDDLFTDEALEGSRVTMYIVEFGQSESSHLVVVDADNYDDFMEHNEARIASHGWSRYQLSTQDSEYVGSTLASVVADHGAPRHTAGYLVAYLINTSDPAGYADAIAGLDDAIGNPGVLRLVAMRSGSSEVTHAVLIGGEDFASVAEYLDSLFESDAFDDFLAKVGDTRTVVGVTWYRRVATWGD